MSMIALQTITLDGLSTLTLDETPSLTFDPVSGARFVIAAITIYEPGAQEMIAASEDSE